MTSAVQSAASPLQIAITTGEPAGVGPELTVQALAGAAAHWPHGQFTRLGDAGLGAPRGRVEGGAVGPRWGATARRVRGRHRRSGAPPGRASWTPPTAATCLSCS